MINKKNMNDKKVNTSKLNELYKKWRGNEACYDNGRPVFEADELLDFAEFCLSNKANNQFPDVGKKVC